MLIEWGRGCRWVESERKRKGGKEEVKREGRGMANRESAGHWQLGSVSLISKKMGKIIPFP